MKRNKHPSWNGRQYGIRSRVRLYLGGFVLFVIALLWLFQTVWLDDFFRWEKERLLISASRSVAQNIESPRLDRLMEHYASRNDMCISLLDATGETVVSSSDSRSCLIHRMSRQKLSYWCEMAPEDGSEFLRAFTTQLDENDYRDEYNGYVPAITSGESESLLCASRVTLSDGVTVYYLLLNTSVIPLDATVSTLRTLLAAITVVTVLVAMGLSGFITRRITTPIIDTNEAARALARASYQPPESANTYREIAELNATLASAAHELSQVEVLQHELIANISHDLRTPLTMIGGYAEVMRDIPGEASPENLQIVIDETNRLTTLVNELLDFSRLQTGHSVIQVQPFCLTASVREIVQRVAKLVENEGYRLRFAPEEDVFVSADEGRIAQVVYNLVGNALTYTGPDRTVTLTQCVRGDTVRLCVADTGKGIPNEELPLIWNRYYRTRESHRRAVIGSGLGLSIVRSILEKHGARYGVDSTVGQGTTFWFELNIVPGVE